VTKKEQTTVPAEPPSSPRRFGGVWAKTEIFLGLTAAGVGLFLAAWLLSHTRADLDWYLLAAALALFVLGGYLTLAGQRSHLYRSNLQTAAFLAAAMHRLQEKVNSDEHPR
jgi:hypothetical protein